MSKNEEITVYRPNQRHDYGFLMVLVTMTRNIIKSKDLIWVMFKRDFFAAYKKSFIGISWIFIGPIIGIISWVFMQFTGVLKPGEVGIPYPAYILIGSSMWGLFMGVYRSAAETLTAGAGLQFQVNYPHETLLFKNLAAQIANFTISLAVNLVVLLAFGVVPAWTTILLPAVVIPMFLLAAAIGLVASMVTVVAFDINNILNLGMGMLLYLTPIIYSAGVDNAFLQASIKWNPLTYLVCSARDIIIYGRLYDPQGYMISSGIALVLFLFSWRLFFVSENKIIERMI